MLIQPPVSFKEKIKTVVPDCPHPGIIIKER